MSTWFFSIPFSCIKNDTWILFLYFWKAQNIEQIYPLHSVTCSKVCMLFLQHLLQLKLLYKSFCCLHPVLSTGFFWQNVIYIHTCTQKPVYPVPCQDIFLHLCNSPAIYCFILTRWIAISWSGLHSLECQLLCYTSQFFFKHFPLVMVVVG